MEENTREALFWYRRGLEGGADDVHADLGQLLCDHTAGALDVERAVEVLREGWDKYGDATCAGVLAELFEDEFNDEARSIEWSHLAADAGDASAMVTLGYRHRYGQGVPRDLKAMLRWYRAAAALGDATAMANLAICYQDGEGVKQDSQRAFALRTEARDLGHYGSRVWLAFACIDGTGCEIDVERGMAELKELAESDPEVAHDFADRLIDGPGLTPDPDEGIRWMRLAGERGYGPALTYLGVLYWYGRFVEEDRAKAIELYRKAADLGDSYALGNLGYATLGGDIVPRDERRGVELLETASERGNAQAALWLAERRLEGDGGFHRDEERAVKFLEACIAVEEDGDALYALAELTRDGRGAKQDLAKALELFELAEINGRDTRVERGQLRRRLRG